MIYVDGDQQKKIHIEKVFRTKTSKMFYSYSILMKSSKMRSKFGAKLERMRREKFNFFRFAFYIEMEFCGCQENTNNSTCISMKVLFMRFLRRKTFFFHFPKSHQVPSRPRKTFIINDVIHFPFRKQSDICVDQCFHLDPKYGFTVIIYAGKANKQPTREETEKKKKSGLRRTEKIFRLNKTHLLAEQKWQKVVKVIKLWYQSC